MKDSLGISPSKGNQGTTRGKEKIEKLSKEGFLCFIVRLVFAMEYPEQAIKRTRKND